MLLMALLFGGCGSGADTGEGRSAAGQAHSAGTAASAAGGLPAEPEGARLQVVATIFPQYDIARQIAGPDADVSMLLKPGEEVHSYEPTPQDIRRIQSSGLFLYTGGENDVWVENILESIGPGPRAVRLLDLVDTYAEEQLEGMMPERGGGSHGHEEDGGAEESVQASAEEDEEANHGREEDGSTEEEHAWEQGADPGHAQEDGSAGRAHVHVREEEPDEHVWTSPENCCILIGKITDIFCALDPAHAGGYRARGEAYRAEFERLDADYREMVGAAAARTIIFGDRFPFRYLAEEFGLTCYAAFSGCSSESEPSAATVAFLIDKTVEERAPVVFQIEFSNGNIARAIAEAADARLRKQARAAAAGREVSGGSAAQSAARGGKAAGEAGEAPAGIRVLQLHSCHNVTRDEFAAGETCLSLMGKNLEALRAALGAP